MTRFDKLVEAYDTAYSDRQAYWEAVRQAIHVFAKEFREYLGVEAEQKIDLKGKGSTKVLSIGGLNSLGGFENLAFDEWPRTKDSVQFALKLAFGNDPSGETPTQVVYRLSIKRGGDDDVFEVRVISDFDAFETKGPSFHALCEHLWQEALGTLRPRK